MEPEVLKGQDLLSAIEGGSVESPSSDSALGTSPQDDQLAQMQQKLKEQEEKIRDLSNSKATLEKHFLDNQRVQAQQAPTVRQGPDLREIMARTSDNPELAAAQLDTYLNQDKDALLRQATYEAEMKMRVENSLSEAVRGNASLDLLKDEIKGRARNLILANPSLNPDEAIRNSSKFYSDLLSVNTKVSNSSDRVEKQPLPLPPGAIGHMGNPQPKKVSDVDKPYRREDAIALRKSHNVLQRIS